MRSFVLLKRKTKTKGGGTSSARGLRDVGDYKMKFIAKLGSSLKRKRCKFCHKIIPASQRNVCWVERDNEKYYFCKYSHKRNFINSLKPNYKTIHRREGL